MAARSLMLGVVGRNLLVERGSGNCIHGGGGNNNSDGKGGYTDKKLADCKRVAERDERGLRQCQGEGGQLLHKTRGNLDCRGHTGAMMTAFESFLLLRILLSAKTFP
jgi:hypothetical protein